jgi:CubicO group peptidase (beta-lactamase class C family)
MRPTTGHPDGLFISVYPITGQPTRLRSFSFHLFLIICAFNIITGCNTSTNAKEPIKDTVHVTLPPNELVPEAEVRRIQVNCENWYNGLLKNSGFNGGILVAKNGNIVFEKYKGDIHIGKKDSITDSTAFHIASVSKTFTAMAVLKLMQEGKCNLDDEFSKYLLTFNYPGVTIRSLLNHRSGLPNYIYFMEDLHWDKKVFMTNQDIFDWMVNRKNEIRNISSPNTHFTYCNTNYALLALLIEKISGITYPKYLKTTFFQPLNMNHSFVYTIADSARANPSYDWRGIRIPDNFLDHVYGDKNIYSTPRDLLIWDKALRSNLFFGPTTLEQAYTPYSNEKPGIRNYGLGWRMNIYPDGKKMIFHNGWWHGNNAVFIRLLEENATIIVLGSRFTHTVYKAKNLVNIFNNYFVPDEDE